MNPTCPKNNLFVLQSGKILTRPTTSQSNKNYRYIPYDPLNNPAPEDYFRETISNLQKQISSLKQQVSNKQSTTINPQTNENQQILAYKKQLAFMNLHLLEKEKELKQKDLMITMKDKMILENRNENTRLHTRINGLMNQIQTLKKSLNKKDELILNKNEEIEEYCQALERITAREKQQHNTMFSSNYLMTTPRIQFEDQQSQEQFYSPQKTRIQAKILSSKRYMTPQILTSSDQNQLIDEDTGFKSARNMRVNSEQDISDDAQLGEIEKNGKGKW